MWGVMGLGWLWAWGYNMGVSENRGGHLILNFGGSYNKHPTIEGAILGSPIFGNPPI